MTDSPPSRPSAPSPWLAAAQAGDRDAFDRLVRPMLGNLRALCRRLVVSSRADDLLQEGLIRAHRGLAGFRCESSFRSWIVRILMRAAIEPARFDPARSLPGQRDLSMDVVPEALVPEALAADPLTHVSARDTLRRVEEAMERLPLRQRSALHLRAVEGWDYAEIARALETSPGAVRMAVLSARRKLRERLGEAL